MGSLVCTSCGTRHRVRLVPLPLTGEQVALCDLCRGRRSLAHMRGLVAHG